MGSRVGAVDIVTELGDFVPTPPPSPLPLFPSPFSHGIGSACCYGTTTFLGQKTRIDAVNRLDFQLVLLVIFSVLLVTGTTRACLVLSYVPAAPYV